MRKRSVKRLFAAVLAGAMVMGMAACSSSETGEKDSGSSGSDGSAQTEDSGKVVLNVINYHVNSHNRCIQPEDQASDFQRRPSGYCI